MTYIKIAYLCAVIFTAILAVMAFLSPTPGTGSTTLDRFLADDKTNEHPYTINYNCVDFSWTLYTNARAKGFAVQLVIIYTDTQAHQFVVFHVSGKNYFVEPQSDKEYIAPTIGHPLCFSDGSGCPFKEPITDIIY